MSSFHRVTPSPTCPSACPLTCSHLSRTHTDSLDNQLPCHTPCRTPWHTLWHIICRTPCHNPQRQPPSPSPSRSPSSNLTRLVAGSKHDGPRPSFARRTASSRSTPRGRNMPAGLASSWAPPRRSGRQARAWRWRCCVGLGECDAVVSTMGMCWRS
jgi:hypothetical protein